MIGNGNAVDIATKIFDDLRGSIEGLLGIDHKLLFPSRVEEILKASRVTEVSKSRRDLELAANGGELFEELGPKNLGKRMDRKKKFGPPARDPLTGLGVNCSCRDQAMKMDVIHDFLVPGVQHRDEPEPPSEFLLSEFLERFRDRLKQKAIDELLVPERNRIE